MAALLPIGTGQHRKRSHFSALFHIFWLDSIDVVHLCYSAVFVQRIARAEIFTTASETHNISVGGMKNKITIFQWNTDFFVLIRLA
jgi:hypothetical protein